MLQQETQMQFPHNLAKKSPGDSNIFAKNRFYLLHEEDNLENVIIEKNMDSEESNNINEH